MSKLAPDELAKGAATVGKMMLPDIVNGLVEESMHYLGDVEAKNCADIWLTTASVLGLSREQIVIACSMILVSASVEVRDSARRMRA